MLLTILISQCVSSAVAIVCHANHQETVNGEFEWMNEFCEGEVCVITNLWDNHHVQSCATNLPLGDGCTRNYAYNESVVLLGPDPYQCSCSEDFCNTDILFVEANTTNGVKCIDDDFGECTGTACVIENPNTVYRRSNCLYDHVYALAWLYYSGLSLRFSMNACVQQVFPVRFPSRETVLQSETSCRCNWDYCNNGTTVYVVRHSLIQCYLDSSEGPGRINEFRILAHFCYIVIYSDFQLRLNFTDRAGFNVSEAENSTGFETGFKRFANVFIWLCNFSLCNSNTRYAMELNEMMSFDGEEADGVVLNVNDVGSNGILFGEDASGKSPNYFQAPPKSMAVVDYALPLGILAVLLTYLFK